MYVCSAVDVKGKFAFSLPYRPKTSANALDFWRKLMAVYPVPIRDVQMQNGAGFLSEFDESLTHAQIPHRFTYPRCPKVHEHLIHSPREFHLQLADNLVFYNCERAHHALHLQTPLAFLLTEGALSKMSVTHTLV